MHRKGHIGITLLLYAPVILLTGTYAPELLLFVVLGAVILVDLLLPVTGVLHLAGYRGWLTRLSFTPAMAPDLDMKLPGVKHRGMTHTVWFGLAFGAAFAVLGVYLAPLAEGWLVSHTLDIRLVGAAVFGYVGFHAVVTHLLGDVITPAGICPFAPLSDAKYSFALARAANPVVNLLCYLLGVVATLGALALVLA